MSVCEKNTEHAVMIEASDIAAMFGAGAVKTFFGLPACQDLDTLKARAAVVGAPCASPYKSVGAYCANGPGKIRAAVAGYAANITHMNELCDHRKFQRSSNRPDPG